MVRLLVYENLFGFLFIISSIHNNKKNCSQWFKYGDQVLDIINMPMRHDDQPASIDRYHLLRDGELLSDNLTQNAWCEPFISGPYGSVHSLSKLRSDYFENE